MPAPALLRIDLDFEGALPSPFGSSASLLVNRPPAGAPIVAAFLHWGIPLSPMPFFTNPLLPGVELWMDPASPFTTSISQFAVPGFDQSVRFLLAFPPGSNVYVAQAVCMLAGGTFAGSPGMVINY